MPHSLRSLLSVCACILFSVCVCSCSVPNRDSIPSDAVVEKGLWQPGTPHLFDVETKEILGNRPEDWDHLEKGWQTREGELFLQKEWVWATRLDASLNVVVLRPRNLEVVLKLMPNVIEAMPAQRVDITWEKTNLGTCEFDKAQGWKTREFRFTVPAAAQRIGQNRIGFRSRFAASKKDVGEGNEEREAAVALLSLRIEDSPAPNDGEQVPVSTAALSFKGKNIVQPGGTRLRIPTRSEGGVPRWFRCGPPAFSDSVPSGRILARWDSSSGPRERLVYDASKKGQSGSIQFRIPPHALGRIEFIFDTTTASPDSSCVWQEPVLLTKSSAKTATDEMGTIHAPAGITRVVLVVLDALRADALGCYGNTLDTSPFINQIAATGLVFERAYSSVTETYGSTTSLLTSLYPFQHGVLTANDRLADPTLLLQHQLGEAGVFTGGMAQNCYISNASGLAGSFKDFRESFGHTHEACKKSLSDAIDVVASHAEAPAFFYLHYLPPHAPYSMAGPFLNSLSEDPVKTIGISADDVSAAKERRVPTGPLASEQLRRRYLENVRWADKLVEETVNGLRAKGFGAETLLIITADHGEAQGQHGWFGHGGIPYNTQCRVPLIINTLAAEGLAAPTRIERVVGTLDLYTTICSLLGVATPAHAQGNNLFGPPASRVGVQAFCHGIRDKRSEAYVFGRYKLVLNRVAGRTEVYDMRQDPAERHNLAGSLPVLADLLTAEALQWRTEKNAAFHAEPTKTDTELKESTVETVHEDELRALGYL